jgi:hypothetical protein
MQKNQAHPGTGQCVVGAALLALSLSVVGCSSNSATPMEAVIRQISPETPGQVARDAFNVYDADIRRNSVNSLSAARFGGEEAYLRLYRLLIDDPDPTVRAACCKALGLHGDTQDIPAILNCAKDESTAVRWEAAKALQKIHSPSAVDVLMEMAARDTDSDVRQAAVTALGQYPTVAVFNVLVGALDDRTYSVVDAAHESLKTLTGYDFGTDGSAWLIFARKDSSAIFTHQKQYYWQPYNKPYTTSKKLLFWKKKPEPLAPQIPRGMEPVSSR